MPVKELWLLAKDGGVLSLGGGHHGGLGWTSLSLTHAVLPQWAGPLSRGLVSC